MRVAGMYVSFQIVRGQSPTSFFLPVAQINSSEIKTLI